MSNGNIYDPTAQVGTAIAERKYKKTQADIERRKAWAETGRDSAWELAKAGSKFQRERMNEKMFGTKVPGFDDVSVYQRKSYDNILDEIKSKVLTRPSDFEYTQTFKRHQAELGQIGGKWGAEGSKAYQKAASAFEKEFPEVVADGTDLANKSKEHFGKALTDNSLKFKETTKAFGWGKRSLEESNKLSGVGKILGSKGGATLQVGTGLYSLTNPKSSTAQQFGGAAQVALGVNAGLQAFGMANLWNPAGVGSLAASFGASLFQSGAFG